MDWELLHKYLSGECTSEEKNRVDAWLQEDREHQYLLDSLSKIWEISPKDEMHVDSQSAWNSFQDKISSEKEPPAKDKNAISGVTKLVAQPYSKRKSNSWLSGTAVAVAILLTGLFMYNFLGSQNSSNKNSSLTKNKQPHVVVTERGQRTLFKLPDGTRIHLNAASKVEIPASFGDSLRRINLEGEAYFDVIHDQEKPFIVHSGDSYTKVLGTKFGVKAYPDDSSIQVVVEEGKVALERSRMPSEKSMRITKNRLGFLSKSGEAKQIEISELAQFLGWKDGRLVFNSTPVEEVIRRLERWYNIDIAVGEVSIRDQTMTASFHDEPMMEVLNILAASLNAEYKQKGRKIILIKKQT
ncbi:FecR domain-containing protein [Fodinibius salsisoli]|uniref:FecR domain-containing protein n=1 Tax=Fodinibius salsisoli TaxID=2820877 RepID=A0ABT3PKL7_9BACT|nr:FecR domain-containing protein [Fodinibius salsisoli]MCW9706491.1 FecR domain-containing protein [Fodinibius salsisoli]